MEIVYILLGVGVLYIWGHFLTLQFSKTWKDRTGYEKFLSVASIALFVMYIIGS